MEAGWRLGEKSGILAQDSAGFNDATYAGAVTLGAPGAFQGDADTAMAVTGGAHAGAPYSPTLNPSTPFSVEFLAKPAVSGQQSTCVIGSQNRAIGRSGYAIYEGLNGPFREAHLGDATTVRLWMFGTAVPQAGQWYHVVLVYVQLCTHRAAGGQPLEVHLAACGHRRTARRGQWHRRPFHHPYRQGQRLSQYPPVVQERNGPGSRG